VGPFWISPNDQLDRAAQAAGFSMGEDDDKPRYTIADEIRDDWIFFAVMIGLIVFVAAFAALGVFLLGWWR
jgi:hypothetical protein